MFCFISASVFTFPIVHSFNAWNAISSSMYGFFFLFFLLCVAFAFLFWNPSLLLIIFLFGWWPWQKWMVLCFISVFDWKVGFFSYSSPPNLGWVNRVNGQWWHRMNPWTKIYCLESLNRNGRLHASESHSYLGHVTFYDGREKRGTKETRKEEQKKQSFTGKYFYLTWLFVILIFELLFMILILILQFLSEGYLVIFEIMCLAYLV